MLLTMLAVMAVIQDGPIRTAPATASPDPACSFGGRPVHGQGCPTPPDRVDPTAPATPAETRPRSTVDFSAYAAEVEARNREAGAQADDLDFEAALAASYGTAAEPTIPAWAFTDRGRWERSQCGEKPEDNCLRTARNRLAMARAEQAEAAPVERAGPAPERCRSVWTPAAEGVGGSFSRICGDEGASALLLEDMRRRDEQTRQDAERDCVRRPETTDQGVRWTLVCGSTPNRERANDTLDSLLR